MNSEAEQSPERRATATFKRVEIVNDAGDLIMSLGADLYGKDPEIRMYTSEGDEALVLFARVNNDCGVSILAKCGKVKVSMCSTPSTHGVVVYDLDGNLLYEVTM